MTPPLSRLAAPLALGLAALLGPLQSVIWNGPDAPSWARTVARAIEPSLSAGIAVSALAEPPPVYFSHGRLFVVVYLLLLVAVTGASAALGQRLSRVLRVLLAIATTADVLAYWLSEAAGPGLRKLAFWGIEVPVLVLLLVTLTLHGSRRLRASPSGWAFVLALPAGLLATWALRYMPHGPVLGLAFALTVETIASLRGEALPSTEVAS